MKKKNILTNISRDELQRLIDSGAKITIINPDTISVEEILVAYKIGKISLDEAARLLKLSL